MSACSEHQDVRLGPRIQARLRLCDEAAEASRVRIDSRIGDTTRRLFGAQLRTIMSSADTFARRMRALYKLADRHMSYTRGIAPCKRGCSHCCHIAVGLARPEAELLGRAIGRRPFPVFGYHDLTRFAFGYDKPCPFLKDNECSIYEHRPLACRVHINMDSEPTLCELDPPLTHPVPYLNTLAYHEAYVQICASPDAGDIRMFFPPGVL